MSLPAHPPPPWRLHGEAAILPAPVRAGAARAAGLPPGVRLLAAGGWTVGGLLLARYDAEATLPYHELIVFSGLATKAESRAPAFVVSHIYVDSPASLAGGRAIWGLPKELATFVWGPRAVEVVHEDGRPLLRASLRRRTGRAGLPLPAPVLGTDAGGAGALRTAGSGRLGAAAPVLARLEVPARSPFAGLGLPARLAGVAGDALDLVFPAPA